MGQGMPGAPCSEYSAPLESCAMLLVLLNLLCPFAGLIHAEFFLFRNLPPNGRNGDHDAAAANSSIKLFTPSDASNNAAPVWAITV